MQKIDLSNFKIKKKYSIVQFMVTLGILAMIALLVIKNIPIN